MNVFKKSVLAIGVGTALSALMAPNAQAVGFNWGDIEGSFNSTFSYGVSVRAENRDFENQIGKANNPRNGIDWTGYSALSNSKYSSSELFAMSGSYSTNGDLGNLAWSNGEAFSQIVKGLHELDLRYENYGLFVRGMYYHDFALDGALDYQYEIPGADGQPRDIDVCRDKEAKANYCSDIRLLDAYFSADFDFGEVPVSFRIGQQVISWGESALISHGIAATNAVDLGRLRAPGAELKEVFIPQGMAWFSAGLTENLSMEAYYQYEWQGTVVPVGGTYFASNDFVSDGGQYNLIQLGFSGNPDIDGDFLISELEKVAGLGLMGADDATMRNAMLAYSTKVAVRKGEVEPEDGGQYGIKVGYFFEDTEVALYHMNYHSRRPLISGQASDFSEQALLGDVDILKANFGSVNYDTLNELSSFTKAIIEFPEDIKLYGVSFNTTLGDTSFAGEVSHRQDEPLQIDDVELLFAAMPQQLANAGLRPELDGISQLEGTEYPFPTNPDGSLVGIKPGDMAHGYVTVDTTQAQFNLAHLFGPTMGADNLTMFAEFGAIWIHDMPDPDLLRLNGPGTSRSGGGIGKEALMAVVHNGVEQNPFPTDFAWGYRMVAKADYNNVFSGVNAAAKIVFSHDVEGITPDPLFLFTQGAKSIGASIDFDYQNRWSASVGYNAFWGGKGSINTMEDKDFVSFNIKYSI